MTEIDYSMEYHHVNCDEYFWPESDSRIVPCILFFANTRDRKLYQENVSILSQMYKSLGCCCLHFEYIAPPWMNILPAFESSFDICDSLGQQLIKIIKDNELDHNPLIVHVIGSDGAMIYARIHGQMKEFISGAIIESLPKEDQQPLSTTTSIRNLQSQMNADLNSWMTWWQPQSEGVRHYLTLALSSGYVLWHKVYQFFAYRDLQSRLKRMQPDWRELIICEPANVTFARSFVHERRLSLVPKKLLKFPPLRQTRNSIYQQNPRQYENKISQFISSVCDDFVTKNGAIESAASLPVVALPIDMQQPANMSESTIQPVECASLQSTLVPSETESP